MYVVMPCPHVRGRLPQCTAQCKVSTALLFVSWLAVSSGEAVVKCFVASSGGRGSGTGKAAKLWPVFRGILGVVETELEKCWGQTEAALFLRTMDKTAH